MLILTAVLLSLTTGGALACSAASQSPENKQSDGEVYNAETHKSHLERVRKFASNENVCGVFLGEVSPPRAQLLFKKDWEALNLVAPQQQPVPEQPNSGEGRVPPLRACALIHLTESPPPYTRLPQSTSCAHRTDVRGTVHMNLRLCGVGLAPHAITNALHRLDIDMRVCPMRNAGAPAPRPGSRSPVAAETLEDYHLSYEALQQGIMERAAFEARYGYYTTLYASTPRQQWPMLSQWAQKAKELFEQGAENPSNPFLTCGISTVTASFVPIVVNNQEYGYATGTKYHTVGMVPGMVGKLSRVSMLACLADIATLGGASAVEVDDFVKKARDVWGDTLPNAGQIPQFFRGKKANLLTAAGPNAPLKQAVDACQSSFTLSKALPYNMHNPTDIHARCTGKLAPVVITRALDSRLSDSTVPYIIKDVPPPNGPSFAPPAPNTGPGTGDPVRSMR